MAGTIFLIVGIFFIIIVVLGIVSIVTLFDFQNKEIEIQKENKMLLRQCQSVSSEVQIQCVDKLIIKKTQEMNNELDLSRINELEIQIEELNKIKELILKDMIQI